MKAREQRVAAVVMLLLCVMIGSMADKVVGQVIAWVAASADASAGSDVSLD